MTDQLDLDGLERLAKAATPGPWVEDTIYSKYAVVRLSYGPKFRTGRKKLLSMAKTLTSAAGQKAAHDAAYIAAANPATILALISQAREAERMRGAAVELQAARHARWIDPTMANADRVSNASDALDAALAPATGGGDA